jgi:hypothetical protein
VAEFCERGRKGKMNDLFAARWLKGSPGGGGDEEE